MVELTEDIKRRMKYNLLLTNGGTFILKEYCKKIIEETSKSLKELIDEDCRYWEKRLTTKVLDKIKAHTYDTSKFDMSLLTSVILKMFAKKISNDERMLISNIRDRRNTAAHPDSFEFHENDFNFEWERLSGWFIQLSQTINNDVYDVIQRKVKEYKIINISKSDNHDDLSNLQELLWNFLSNTFEAEETKQKLTEVIETLKIVKEKDYGYGVNLKIHLHSFDVDTRRHVEELLALVLNDIVQKAGDTDISNILPVIQTFKQDLSCQGSNQVLNATRKCISITINCHTRKGLLKLLRYFTNDTFRVRIQQIAMGLSKCTSQEVRLTSYISEESLKQITAYIEGSKDIEVPEESTVCKHHGETIKCFCEEHEEFCCKVCLSQNHRVCELQNLGEMKPFDVAPVIKNLDDARLKIQEKKSLFDKEKASIKAARDKKELEISARKMGLLEIVDNLKTQQEECIKYYDKLEQEKGEIIGDEIAACETILKEIKTVQISIESSKSKSKIVQFIANQKCKDMIHKSKSIVEEKQQKWKRIAINPDELKFKLDTKQIEESLQHLQKDILQFKDDQSQSIYTSSLKSEGLLTESKPLTAQDATPKGAMVHVARKPMFIKEDVKQVNVTLNDDRRHSSVRGCCTTIKGDILIVDDNNCKLKRINDRDEIDTVDLKGHPWDVCMADTHTAVVAVLKDTLQFVNTLGKMTIHKSMKLSHNCRSLAFDTANNRLIIPDQSRIYLYTKSVPRKPMLIKNEDIKQADVSLKDDKGPSSIRGCCTTTTGDILIVDNSNCKLKRIKDRNVTDSVDLDGHPWDVCMTDTHTAAVAVYKDTLQFVNTREKMTIHKSLKLSHNCRSLAFDTANNRLLILDQSHVYLYTKSGTMEQVLYSQTPPTISLQVITVSPSCKRYCISSTKGDLIQVDNSGNHIKEHKLKRITGGVCYTSDSNIYVTRKDSVSQLNANFEIKHVFKHGINGPLSVCFNEKESELIIGQDNDTVIIMPV